MSKKEFNVDGMVCIHKQKSETSCDNKIVSSTPRCENVQRLRFRQLMLPVSFADVAAPIWITKTMHAGTLHARRRRAKISPIARNGKC